MAGECPGHSLAVGLEDQRVVQSGSFAKGDINEGFDVDIMAIVDFKEGFLDRAKLLLDVNDELKLPLEPIGYTPEQFKRMRAEGNHLIREVVESGNTIYGMIPEGGG